MEFISALLSLIIISCIVVTPAVVLGNYISNKRDEKKSK